jgi:hypothetical protein
MRPLTSMTFYNLKKITDFLKEEGVSFAKPSNKLTSMKWRD